MSSTQVVILGAIAGLTIFGGLPFGRLTGLRASTRATLNAIAIGILIFLLWDVLSHAIEPIETALTGATDTGDSTWAEFAGLAAAFTACLALGLLSLVYYDRHLHRVTGTTHSVGAAVSTAPLGRIASLSEAQRLSLFIAMGIGVHNLAEGLAIGQSAANGEISLALALVIGFGLHNST